MLTIRSRDAAAAGLAALVDAHGIAADTLRREIELERLRVLASAPQADRGRLRIPALFPSIAGLRTRLPAGASRQALGFIGVAAAVAVVVGLAVMIGGRGLRTTEPGPAGVAGASATPEQALAGGRSSSAALPSRSPTASVPALVPVRATFDDLVMGEPLAAVWQLTGSAGRAEVAPFPNAVDRSLRVTTSRDGTQTTICRPVSAGAAPARLSVDLFGEALAGVEMSIRTPDPSQQLAAVVDGSGSMMVNPGAMPLVQASLRDARWITLTVEIDPDGTTVGASIDGTSARGTATLPAPLDWTTASLCLRSPSAPAASLYVDNLVVE